MTRARSNTDNELVNLRINLEEAKNENVTILQVNLEIYTLYIYASMCRQSAHTKQKVFLFKFL